MFKELLSKMIVGLDKSPEWFKWTMALLFSLGLIVTTVQLNILLNVLLKRLVGV